MRTRLPSGKRSETICFDKYIYCQSPCKPANLLARQHRQKRALRTVAALLCLLFHIGHRLALAAILIGNASDILLGKRFSFPVESNAIMSVCNFGNHALLVGIHRTFVDDKHSILYADRTLCDRRARSGSHRCHGRATGSSVAYTQTEKTQLAIEAGNMVLWYLRFS